MGELHANMSASLMSIEPGGGMSTSPATVLFSFLSRADSTSLSLRTRRDGHGLGLDGAPVTDPSADPHDNVLEPDPNLNFERWGDYWRKIHGPRFLHPDGEDDAVLDRLLRYDQIHRVSAGPTSYAPLPYKPPVTPDGRLFETIAGHVGPYLRPTWDGVAYLSFANRGDLQTVLGTERVRRKIAPEDKGIFRDLAPMLARRHVIWQNKDVADAVALVKTHVRRPDLDRSEFQRLWLDEHADLVRNSISSARFARRYVQLHNVGPTEQGASLYHPFTSGLDGVTMMTFASMRALEDHLSTDDHVAILQSEDAISQQGVAEFWSGVIFNVVDREAD